MICDLFMSSLSRISGQSLLANATQTATCTGKKRWSPTCYLQTQDVSFAGSAEDPHGAFEAQPSCNCICST